MSAFEFRLIAYILAGLLYTGFIAWGSFTLESHHRDRLDAANQIAQAEALRLQQAQSLATLQAQQAATVAAEKQYADLKSHNDDLASRLARSVQDYTQLRGSLVSATATAAALADAASQGASRDSELARLSGQAAEACLSDSAALTALQSWAHETSTIHPARD